MVEHNNEEPLTLTVPEAGRRYFGLSRNGSYLAAARGEIPTVRIGRLLRVPERAMERVLDAAGQQSAVGRAPNG
jgi:hypothetical protein